ncbi:type II secretion system protein [Pimelobacter simplex]|uniref:type II secretion system protein n=1 Tax=Nocardioides simplex TaxID=2045 RepID=UPI00215009CC|nr:type II secretion system protein [Pimelobacter simplex]UUW87250.1 type II secretion system GspH family protein [Pimelobacter simplex]UUW96756.1 type II secretion system GspH family protein [Pimelobacter simplex]
MRRLSDRLTEARRDQRGFTLIELLIVIVILGVLAGIVVFSVRGITKTGEQAACKTEFRTVNTAIEARYAELGSAAPAPTLALLASGGFLHDTDTKYVTGISAAAPYTATGTSCAGLAE